MKHTIQISGMSCNNCVKHVTHALERIEGVETVEVSLNPQVAQVVSGENVSLESLKEAIVITGYNVK